MDRYFLLSVSTEDMNINIDLYQNYADAYSAMQKEYDEVFQTDNSITDGCCYNDSAYIIGNYEYSWRLESILGFLTKKTA